MNDFHLSRFRGSRWSFGPSEAGCRPNRAGPSASIASSFFKIPFLCSTATPFLPPTWDEAERRTQAPSWDGARQKR